METKTQTSTAKTAYGKVLATPIPYSFTWENYSNFVEVQAAKDELNETEQVNTRNAERQAKARQAALTKALTDAGIEKPTLDNDDLLKLQTLYKVFIAVKGTTEEQARQKAEDAVNLKWADFE